MTRTRTRTPRWRWRRRGASSWGTTAPARRVRYERLRVWARSRSCERLWALADCRRVRLGLERFLLVLGEAVVRVPPKLMAGARGGSRQGGESDAIDPGAIARAALREPDLSLARLEGASREIRLFVDGREDAVCERARIRQRLRWQLHELEPELELPAGCRDRGVGLERLARRLGLCEQTVQVEIRRELLARWRELTRQAAELERRLAALVAADAPALLELPGCGALTAATLVGETAGAGRFARDARLAMHAGAAPVPDSSGASLRHRLNRSGNRQLNCCLHRIAVRQGRVHAPARAYLARKQQQGHSRKEALRCPKRHLAPVVFRTLKAIEEETVTLTKQPAPCRP